MRRPIKYVEKGITKAAAGMWRTVQFFNDRKSPNPSIRPKWTERPTLKSWEKSKPPLGWPRQTDSLCPTCVRQARQAFLDG